MCTPHGRETFNDNNMGSPSDKVDSVSDASYFLTQRLSEVERSVMDVADEEGSPESEPTKAPNLDGEPESPEEEPEVQEQNAEVQEEEQPPDAPQDE